MAKANHLNDTWLRVSAITGIFILSLFANPAFRVGFNSLMVWRALITLFAIALVCECNRAIAIRSRTLFANDASVPKRIAFIFIAGLLCTGFILFCTRFIGSVVANGLSAALQEVVFNQSPLDILRQYILAPLLLFTLFVGVYEALYYYAQLKQIEEEKKRLEKEKAWSQLDQLNQQVNPHFLFNTLNALSSVVTENPEEADKMLNETSKLYRCLLDFNKKDLVTLQDELQFIRSFFQLLQLRYGKGIDLQLPAEGHKMEMYLLPPLTLQLLVENAVKHNNHGKDQPLNIVIAITEGAHITVSNNLQTKKVKPVSHGVGLNNITAKYQLMQQEAPVIQEDGNLFTVSVKLINPADKLVHTRP